MTIEEGVIRANCAIQFVADAGLDVMRRVCGVPQEILVPLARVAMLEVPRLPMPAGASAEKVSIVELFSWVMRLASPMFDLHIGRPVPDPPHAVAA